MEDELPTNLPKRLAARIHPGWLGIHSKKLEGADVALCLREAYDVCATMVIDCGHELDDVVLRKTIPSGVFHFALAKGWFGDLQGECCYENFTKRLGSQIAYWEAKAAALAENWRFMARIRAEWLKIHSKKLEGADTNLCLREAYDAFAMALIDFDQELNVSTLREVIPDCILECYGEKWLSATPPDQRREDLMERLNSRILYWHAEELLLIEEQKSRSALREGRKALQELVRLTEGSHEKIPENVIRAIVAQRHGIQPEEVTQDQIWCEVSRAAYDAVEIVTSVPAAATNDDDRRFAYQLPANTLEPFRNYLSAMIAASASASNESSLPEELNSSTKLDRPPANPDNPASTDSIAELPKRISDAEAAGRADLRSGAEQPAAARVSDAGPARVSENASAEANEPPPLQHTGAPPADRTPDARRGPQSNDEGHRRAMQPVPPPRAEDWLRAFIGAHPGTTMADIKYSARVYTADFQDWRRGGLPQNSVMSRRIEDVLSGTTHLQKKPRKSGRD